MVLKMATCPNCGAVNPDDGAFCSACGAKLEVSQPDAVQQTQMQREASVSQPGSVPKKNRNVIITAVVVVIIVIVAAAAVVLMSGSVDDDGLPSADEIGIADGTYNYEMVMVQDGLYYPSQAVFTLSNNLVVHAEAYGVVYTQSQLDELNPILTSEYTVSSGPQWTDGTVTVGTYLLTLGDETTIVGDNGYLLYSEIINPANQGQLILSGWSPSDGSLDRITPDMTLADMTLYFDLYMESGGDYAETYAVVTTEGGEITYFEIRGQVMPLDLLEGLNMILNDYYSLPLSEGEVIAISEGGSWTNGTEIVQSYRLDLVDTSLTDPLMEVYVSTEGELLYMYLNADSSEIEMFQQGWDKGIA